MNFISFLIRVHYIINMWRNDICIVVDIEAIRLLKTFFLSKLFVIFLLYVLVCLLHLFVSSEVISEGIASDQRVIAKINPLQFQA